jgi:hypothetical protein
MQSQDYSLKDLTLHLQSEKLDIRSIVQEFLIYESIDSPSVRMEMVVGDSNNILKYITGNERVTVQFSTVAGKDQIVQYDFQIYRVGSIVKSERTSAYVIYCVSKETVDNEYRKVFKTFKQKASETVKTILTDKKYLGTSKKVDIEETHGNINFICPSWRPFDCISFITDRSVRSKNKEQSGFMFFENKNGYNFKSVDYLCSSENKTFSNPLKFSYQQKNVTGKSPDDYQTVQQIVYPDKNNTMENLRLGTFGNLFLGMNMQVWNESVTPRSSDVTPENPTKKGGPAGSDYDSIPTSARTAWTKFNHLEKRTPYGADMPDYLFLPTRVRYRFLPSYQFGNDQDPKGGAGNTDIDLTKASAYSLMRLQNLNYIKLTIIVPGNTNVTAGDVIRLSIPDARQQGNKVEEDKRYSGKYLVSGLVHRYLPEGVITTLYISRGDILE